MDLMIKAYLERAQNELAVADLLMRTSQEKSAKEFLGVHESITFYSSVISHSYYAIFYAAKAILLTIKIKTSAPEIHKKTIEEFEKNLVKTGVLDVRLLEIYKTMAVRADGLLEIFKDERWKRGNFTYNTIPQANREPSEDSLGNAKLFVSNISKVIDGM